jgi:DNA-binding NarL/FixJ family response regulator
MRLYRLKTPRSSACRHRSTHLRLRSQADFGTLGDVRLLRILVVDRHRGFAEAVAGRLDMEADLRTVGTAVTGAAAETAVDVLGPDVVLMDMDIEDVSPFELITRLIRREPPVQVVAVFGHDDAEAATDAIRAGAGAVVTKETPIADLVRGVIAVADGGAWVAPHLLSGVLRELSPVPPPNRYGQRVDRLTAREREVLDRMVIGYDRTAIARDLFLSVNTVRTHTKNILAKLEVHSSLEAVSVALRARQRVTFDLD